MGQVIQFSKYSKRGAASVRSRMETGATARHSAANTISSLDRTKPSRRRTDQTNAQTRLVDVSVVVPTCGRPVLLNRCLDALTRQSLDPARYEIIVVDDAPNAATRDAVHGWAARMAARGLLIHYVPSSGPHGPAAARNRGWHAAHANIIAFTDDDTTPDPEWLAVGLDAFRRGAEAVWGRIIMPLEGKPTDYERDAKGLEKAEFVTANCLCRKSVLQMLDGFDERFRLAWREDADFYFRLLRNGVDVRHVPEAVVIHPVRAARWGVSLSQQKKVVFDVLLYKKHPTLYRTKIRPHARMDYYITVLALLVSLIGIVLSAFVVAATAGMIWLGLTARFCARRLSGTVKTPSHIAEMIVTSALIPPIAVFWRVVGMLRFKTLLV